MVKDKHLLKHILQKAPDDVVKAISDVALNALKGPVNLTAAQRWLFARYRKPIGILAQRSVSSIGYADSGPLGEMDLL